MTTQSTQTPPPPAGFWKIRHLVIGGGAIVLIVMLMLRACGSDDAEQEAARDETKNMPRQGVVVEIPASQWPPQQAPVQVQPQVLQPPVPQQPGYGYIPQPLQAPPVSDGGNPWAVQTPQSYDYGQSGGAQWGRTQQQRAPQPQQYVPPPAAAGRYRPLDETSGGTVQRTVPQPQPQPQVQGYRPAAPYDRPAGSSFGAAPQAAYPYGGGYPGYYGGAYGVPVNPYTPGYPVVPGMAWPGVW